jgi:sugar phosphate permease
MANATAYDVLVPSAKTKNRQIIFIILCMVNIAFNYLDRSTVSIAVPQLRAEFGLSATQIGGLLSVWSICYAFGQLPSGFLVDRFGVRVLASGGIFVWSIFQALGGLAGSFTQLFVTRGLLGVAESPTGATNVRVVASWFPKHRRGLPTGIYVAGTQIGPAFAPPLLTALMLWFGWRVMFLTMGVVGIIIAIIYFSLYRDVEKAGLSAQDRNYLGLQTALEPDERVTPSRWLALFRFATVWGLLFGSFCQGWVVWIFIGWLPTYLETEFHLSLAKTGIAAAFPFIGGIAGSLAGGLLSDYLAKRQKDPVRGRKFPIVAGTLLLGLFTAATGFATSVPMALAFSFAALFSSSLTTSGMWVAAAVLVPRGFVSSLGSLFNFASFLGATLSPIVTGLTLDATGSFFTALLFGSVVGVTGGLAMALMIRKPIGMIESGSDIGPDGLIASGKT